MSSNKKYIALARGFFLKELEFPCVYSTGADELYRVDPDGFSELCRCDGTLAEEESRFPADFLDYCLKEGLLEELQLPVRRKIPVGRNEKPSLRYLMMEVTDRCNLSCRHCYLGEGSGRDLPFPTAVRCLDELDDMGGLRLVVTGGEPLLYPYFGELNGLIAERTFRTVLVTNGTLIDESLARSLHFSEVQVSLDGMRGGHEGLRGKGSFDMALSGIEALKSAERQISVATMIYTGNLRELDELERLVRELGAVSWTLDVPSPAGRMKNGRMKLLPELARAARAMERAFGSEQHMPSGDYACGAHLACVKVNGMLTKCGFYEDPTGGPVHQGLRRAWLELPRMRLSELECECEYLVECGGGCRFRAEQYGGLTAPDPVRCAQYGFTYCGKKNGNIKAGPIENGQ